MFFGLWWVCFRALNGAVKGSGRLTGLCPTAPDGYRRQNGWRAGLGWATGPFFGSGLGLEAGGNVLVRFQ